ncbi:hypothetical protein C8J56DRAFT_904173 [Mycena floridula]|nr:hypothetical protein C8J56DRAFT_904173 [Mycena floridula]
MSSMERPGCAKCFLLFACILKEFQLLERLLEMEKIPNLLSRETIKALLLRDSQSQGATFTLQTSPEDLEREIDQSMQDELLKVRELAVDTVYEENSRILEELRQEHAELMELVLSRDQARIAHNSGHVAVAYSRRHLGYPQCHTTTTWLLWSLPPMSFVDNNLSQETKVADPQLLEDLQMRDLGFIFRFWSSSCNELWILPIPTILRRYERSEALKRCLLHQDRYTTPATPPNSVHYSQGLIQKCNVRLTCIQTPSGKALHAKIIGKDTYDEDGRNIVDELVNKMIEVLRKMSLLDPRVDEAIGKARALYTEPTTFPEFDWAHAMRKLPPIYQGPNARHLGINVQLEGQAAEMERRVQAVEDERVKGNLPPFTSMERELVQREIIAQFNADIQECITNAMQYDVQLELHGKKTRNKVLHMAEQIVWFVHTLDLEEEAEPVDLEHED